MITITIHGVPRSKKNSQRLIVAGGRLRIVQSRQWIEYARKAILVPNDVRLSDGHYNVAALVYREANRGDLLNYLAGVSDLLEARGVVRNDVQFVSWDGSRALKDAAHPRVEVTITEVV